MKQIKSRLLILFSLILLITTTFFYNEYLIYWQVIFFNCNWPESSNYSGPFLKMMLIADTHLLGSRNGHWFDKLRREWQMKRAFQTARKLLQPDYIVIMGDVTDEGKWCSDREWKYYENRIEEIFFTKDYDGDKKTQLLIIVGNHDVGFHYDMITHKIERFNRSFKNQFVDLHQPLSTRLDLNFILVNSMALENDGCKFCNKAQQQMIKINKTLNCLKKQSNNQNKNLLIDEEHCLKNEENLIKNNEFKRRRTYSRPILFTHFPLYRQSDDICPDDVDTELYAINKNPNFRPKYDCLSLDATHQLINLLNPRLVFNGHTHYSCFNQIHGVPEYTIASFSWRNIQTPSLLLLQLNEEKHNITKCFLPREDLVINIYILSSIALVAVLILPCLHKCMSASKLFEYYRTSKFLRRKIS